MLKTDMELTIQADDVRQAAVRIRPLARRTPILVSDEFDARAGVHAFFKCENLQRGGAFKMRGASNMILSLAPDVVARGIVAYSSGNHAQAVAIAAAYVGARATIVMPADAPKAKLEATRAHGATVVTYDRKKESREAIAADIVARTGATLVPPFDHPLIMAGQGTAALELFEETGALDALIAPIGGGGLLSGCATIAKSMFPSIDILGAEPESANDAFLSLAAGRRVEAANPDTIADGLRTPMVGELTFPVIRRLVDGIALVSDNELRATVRFFLQYLHILVEPSGAAAAAAVLHRKLPCGIETVGVVLSGGNVDLETVAKY
jgi:threonine dehydratase